MTVTRGVREINRAPRLLFNLEQYLEGTDLSLGLNLVENLLTCWELGGWQAGGRVRVGRWGGCDRWIPPPLQFQVAPLGACEP